MRKSTIHAVLLLVTTSAYAAIQPEEFKSFANSVAQFEQNATSSYDTLRSIHRSYVVAAAADAALTADSFPEVTAAEAGLAGQMQLRNDAVQVLGSYAALLAALAENAPRDTVRLAIAELRADVSILGADGQSLGATAAPVLQAADQMSRDAGPATPSAADIDRKVSTEVKRLEQALGALATTKFKITADRPEILGLRILATGVDEVMRLVEQRKHDEALISLLRTMQPDVDTLTSFISESNSAMKAAKDAMMTRILDRANRLRPAYDAPSRLQFDADMSTLLASNRALGPLLDSVSAAATHYDNAHSELLLVAEKKETPRAGLRALSLEVQQGYRFYRSMESSESSIPGRSARPKPR